MGTSRVMTLPCTVFSFISRDMAPKGCLTEQHKRTFCPPNFAKIIGNGNDYIMNVETNWQSFTSTASRKSTDLLDLSPDNRTPWDNQIEHEFIDIET